MLHMMGHAVFGLLVGVVAKLLVPGRDPGGLFVTARVGMVGGWFGGWIGRALGWYEEGHPGFGMSVVGAMRCCWSIGFSHDSTTTLWRPTRARISNRSRT
jgi:uncharacterized membrane protein YeaQ/YmgE (transglycosylase-associated protein family)